MKVVNWLFEKIIIQVLVTLFIPISAAIGSKLATGDWLEWFATPTNLVWVILAIVLWVVGSAIYRRVKHLRTVNSPPLSLSFATHGGWKTMGTLDYAGVSWNIRVPGKTSSFETNRILAPHDLDIEIPPRCPKCRTELEQKASFWSGYVWQCVKCGFRKRNRDDFYEEARRVGKIARSEFVEMQSEPK